MCLYDECVCVIRVCVCVCVYDEYVCVCLSSAQSTQDCKAVSSRSQLKFEKYANEIPINSKRHSHSKEDNYICYSLL